MQAISVCLSFMMSLAVTVPWFERLKTLNFKPGHYSRLQDKQEKLHADDLSLKIKLERMDESIKDLNCVWLLGFCKCSAALKQSLCIGGFRQNETKTVEEGGKKTYMYRPTLLFDMSVHRSKVILQWCESGSLRGLC